MQLLFMTFNIKHGLDYVKQDRIDLELMANVVEHSGADIVGLNEVRGLGPHAEYTGQTDIISRYLGFHSYFAKAIDFKRRGPYGNALLSRFPIKRAETIIIPDPVVKDEDAYYETRCILKAEIEVAGGLTVLVSHFGLACSERQNAVTEVVRQISKVQGPCVLMGDFNMTPDHHLLGPIYDCMADTAEKGAKSLLSFPSDTPIRKIDYIFASRDIDVISADIPAIVASDHRPYIAVMDVGER